MQKRIFGNSGLEVSAEQENCRTGAAGPRFYWSFPGVIQVTDARNR